jgi:membrane protease YdiL (CAAX protease family)
MQIKTRIHFLGLITLLVFPIPAFWALWYFKEINPWEVLDFNNLINPKTLLGLSWGMIYAVFSMSIFQLKIFGNELDRQEKLIQSMNLNLVDKIFLSFCAGFGEEILFRVGVQHWLGIWITSILFIAIHGYLNPKKWRLSLYGILLLPFILSLGSWLSPMGIWFCIAAHFSYDLMLFVSIDKD